jgi:hypothetical protein
MATKIRANINLHAKVCVLNESAPRESREQQWIVKENCIANDIDYDEWRWRLEKAMDILRDGEVDTYGNYSDDAIGGKFL